MVKAIMTIYMRPHIFLCQCMIIGLSQSATQSPKILTRIAENPCLEYDGLSGEVPSQEQDVHHLITCLTYKKRFTDHYTIPHHSGDRLNQLMVQTVALTM